MKIELDIPNETIANMMISAIESGDPVTTALKGGWCWGIYCGTIDSDPPEDVEIWYADETFWGSDFKIQIVEVQDENIYKRSKTMAQNIEGGAFKVHTVQPADFKRGLEVLAAKYPNQFGQVMSQDTDAPCADIFLQCVLFGEEKYA